MFRAQLSQTLFRFYKKSISACLSPVLDIPLAERFLITSFSQLRSITLCKPTMQFLYCFAYSYPLKKKQITNRRLRKFVLFYNKKLKTLEAKDFKELLA